MNPILIRSEAEWKMDISISQIRLNYDGIKVYLWNKKKSVYFYEINN